MLALCRDGKQVLMVRRNLPWASPTLRFYLTPKQLEKQQEGNSAPSSLPRGLSLCPHTLLDASRADTAKSPATGLAEAAPELQPPSLQENKPPLKPLTDSPPVGSTPSPSTRALPGHISSCQRITQSPSAPQPVPPCGLQELNSLFLQPRALQCYGAHRLSRYTTRTSLFPGNNPAGLTPRRCETHFTVSTSRTDLSAPNQKTPTAKRLTQNKGRTCRNELLSAQTSLQTPFY